MADNDIEQRLRETTQACIDTYEQWSGDKYDAPKREELQEAVHELRKVASRLEIEMAAAERDEMNKKPIPMPSHRATRGKGAEDSDSQNTNGDNNNARNNKNRQGKGGGNRNTGGQRRQSRSSGGSSHQQSGNNDSPAEDGNS